MNPTTRLAMRSLWTYRRPLALTLTAIVLATAFFTAVRLLTAGAANRTDELIVDGFAEIDLVVQRRALTAAESGPDSGAAVRGPVPEGALEAVRDTPGVTAAEGYSLVFGQLATSDGDLLGQRTPELNVAAPRIMDRSLSGVEVVRATSRAGPTRSQWIVRPPAVRA